MLKPKSPDPSGRQVALNLPSQRGPARLGNPLLAQESQMKVLYTAEATATGGREGRVRSDDGALDLDLAIPKELGGPGGLATNPEQLFAAGYSACFDNAMRLVARRTKVALGQESVTAKVGTGPDGSGGYALTVELHIRLPELDSDVAQQLAEAAHRVCPFSNAVRGNVDVKIVVDPAPEVI